MNWWCWKKRDEVRVFLGVILVIFVDIFVIFFNIGVDIFIVFGDICVGILVILVIIFVIVGKVVFGERRGSW